MHILGGGRFCKQGLWSFGTCVLPYFNFLFTFLVFWDRVSLCSPGCPGNHSVDQAVFEPRNPPVSASQVLELKACATPFLFILFKYVCLHVLCVCMFMSGALRGQKVTHLELKFQMESACVCWELFVSPLQEQCNCWAIFSTPTCLLCVCTTCVPGALRG